MRSFIKSYGMVHPLGFSSEEVFEAIVAGKSGVKEIRKPYLDKPVFAAYFSEKQIDSLNRLCPFNDWNRFEKMLWLAGKEALEKAAISITSKILTLVATTKGGIEDIEKGRDSLFIRSSVEKVVNKLIPQIPFFIVSNACISGLSAIIAGKRFLQTSDFDYVMIIGADTVSDFVLSGFNSLLALSDRVCRPFDKSRNGINLGEGAAAIILQKDENHGIALAGGAITNDANHISGPSRTGSELAEAIRKTMQAGDFSEFDFLSTHGTATVYNDEMESKAFAEAGISNVPMHSLKPYLGHTLGAAGVLEAVICIKSLEENILIPSLGYSEQGTSQALNIQTELERKTIKRTVKTMSGFGGCNAAVCFEKL